MRGHWIRIVALLVFGLASNLVHAQILPGSSPPATLEYCPNNTGGQCYSSRQAAVDAMRAADAEVGQYLTEQIPEPNAETTTIRYGVPNQPPASYSPPLYGINTQNWVYAEQFCPNSNWDDSPRTIAGDNLCTSEDELVQGYIAANYYPGPGMGSCANRDPHLVGQPVLPFRSAGGGVLHQYEQFTPTQRALEWTQDCKDWDNNPFTRVVKAEIYRWQRFYCPAGFSPIDTYDPAVHPNLCRSSKTAWINVRHLQDSCRTVGNPCNPASGEKSSAETDFTFAGRPFTRYYHSLRQLGIANAKMGPGWTHTYSTYMGIPGWMLKIVSGEGYFLRYKYVSTNRYAVIGASGSTIGALEKLANGNYQMTDNSGQVSVFSGAGILLSISDTGRPERDVTLSYENNSQGRLRLSKGTDSAGRELRFFYDNADFLTGALLPDGQLITYGYDGNQNLVSVEYGNGQVKQYLYGEPTLAPNGDQGLLTGIVSETGERSGTYTYDDYGRVVKSVRHGADGPTESTELSYLNATQVAVRTSNGEVRTYTFNTSRQLLSITGDGYMESSVFDVNSGRGWLNSETDRNGNLTQYSHNNSYQQTARTEAANDTTGAKRTIQTDWHATLHQPTERRMLNAAGTLVAKTTWAYNTRGQVLTATQTDPVSGTTRTSTMTWCEQANVDAGTCPRVGLMTSVNGSRTDVADVTSYAYYASDDPGCTSSPTTCPRRKGDLWKVTNALNQTSETLAYDGAGRPLAVKDANGIVTEMTYHPRGWLTSRTIKGATAASDRSTLIDYWPTGLVKRVTQEDGSYVGYTYDAAHRLTDITDSAGNAIHYSLDNAGNRSAEQTRDPNGALTRSLSRIHDTLGRLQSQADAYGHATGFTYDANGSTDIVTDALGRSTDNAYDPLNRLVQTIQDIGGIAATTQFQYDAQDNLTRVTDPKGLNTDYTYNGLGDLTALASPDTGATTYTYDSAGNRASQTDARAKTQVYSYDVLNRLTKVTNPTRTYTYDNSNTTVCPGNERYPKGRLTGLSDQTGTTKYCYNRFGDMIRKVQTTNGVVFVTRYAFDAAGRLATMTYPDGAVMDMVRNGEGQVRELGLTPSGGVRRVVVTGATYAPFGPSTGWAYGNGRTFTRSLNQNYQPQAILDSAVGGLSLGYGFDAAGNLTLLQDAAATIARAQYGYDGLNRLAQVMDGPTGTPIETYGYDATGNRTSLLRAGVTTGYTYSGSSHRLNKVGTVARTYDAAGSTTQIGGTARQFVYDTSGRMTQTKTGSTVQRNYLYSAKGEQLRSYMVTTANTYFVHDEAGHLLGEYDNAGLPIQQMIWFGDLPVGVLQGAGTSQRLHYIEPDHLGTPRVVIDGQRNVPIWEWKLTGEAFGATPPNQDPDADGTAFVFDLRFPGQRYDGATGLNYNYFRDYDPATGRYVESDPIGLDGGISTYGYVGGNPLTFDDLYGLAYLAMRPLEGMLWLGLLSNNPIDANLTHLAISHEQLFFEDGQQPANIGFFDDSTLKTEINPRGYHRLAGKYDDCIMRKAVNNVKVHSYHLVGNNCQNWIADVLAEYERIKNELGSCGCQK